MNKEHDGRPIPLAIVGMACRFPKAPDLRAFWGNVLDGRDCISDVPASHWRAEDYYDADPKAPDRTYARRGGFIEPVPFDPLEYGIPPAALEATDTSQLLGMVVAKEALADAGYTGKAAKPIDRDRVSVILGVTGTLELVIPLGARLGHPLWRKALLEAGVDGTTAEQIVNRIADGYVPWQENSFPGLLGNVVAGRIANFLDLGGTNCVVDAACASALSAMHLAALELYAGRADMVLTGGIDTFNDIFMYMCFSKTPALSPSGDARPFDAECDGTILGEGLGVLALKRLIDAERDGDRIYAVLRAMGSGSDGKGNAIYAPSSSGQAKALREAYALSGVEPRSVAMVEAHGTGTKVGDATEVRALQAIYGTAESGQAWCALGSVKSQIGHTKAAAGIAGIMKAAMALDRKTIPPTIKVREPLGELRAPGSAFYVNTQARPWMPKSDHPRRAGVSAFGFGGSNFHCVLEEYGHRKQTIDWDGRVQILAFHGARFEDLVASLSAWAPPETWPELEHQAARSRREFDGAAGHRLILVLERERCELAKTRQHALALLEKHRGRGNWSSPDGVFYGHGARPGKLGVIFPGQGSQYVGMLRDLACRFPQMRGILAKLNEICAGWDDSGAAQFTDLIFPHPAFCAEDAEAQEARLRLTQVAQPAIGAVSVGALEVLNHFGVRAEAMAGHSFGEITALCAAGRFDREAFYMLARLRGQLMASGEGDKGAMLAVRAGSPELEALVAEHHLDVVLANKNAPDQVVLSGGSAAIDQAARLLADRGLSFKRLPVAAAFHSDLVARAREPFSAELRKITFNETRVPVYSNTTGAAYPESEDEARELLADQLSRPVEFVEEIRTMYGDGVRAFLEVGPGARLTGLVKSILKDEPAEAFALDASSGERSGLWDLAKALAWLGSLGYAPDLRAWEDGGPPERAIPEKPRMTVMLSGANYLGPKTRARVERKLEPIIARQADRGDASAGAPPGREPSRTEHSSPRNLPRPDAPELRQTQPTPANQTQRGKTPTPMNANILIQALELSQTQIASLQKMQEETARLHRVYLAGQETAQKNLMSLMAQQSRWLELAAGGSPLPAQMRFPETGVERIQSPPEAAGRVGEGACASKDFSDSVGMGNHARTAVAIEGNPASPAAPSPARATTSAAVVSTTHTDAGMGANIEKALIEVVAEKTGYPPDMLELEMSLDADLGIDSIKRVEILSALQERLPGLAKVQGEQMGVLRTLADIVALLNQGTAAAFTAVHHAAPSMAAKVPPRPIADLLLEVVADKTGYPADSLELAMSLDADLGIDSIKRVEILASLREVWPQAPEIPADRIGSLQTLGDIVNFLDQLTGVGDQPVSAQVAPNRPPQRENRESGSGTPTQKLTSLLAVIAEKTGYPEDMLEPGMHLEADLGIDSIKRVEIFAAMQEAQPGLPESQPEELGRLTTIAEVVQYFSRSSDSPSGRTAPATRPIAPNPRPVLSETPQSTSRNASKVNDVAVDPGGGASLQCRVPVMSQLPEVGASLNLAKGTLIWLAGSCSALDDLLASALTARGYRVFALDPRKDIPTAVQESPAALILVAPVRDDSGTFLKRALQLVQAAAPGLRAAGEKSSALLAAITPLGGSFALRNLAEDADPVMGALAGLIKTAAIEWPEVTCRAIDWEPSQDSHSVARLLDQVFRIGPVEIALDAQHAWSVALEDQTRVQSTEVSLVPGDLVIVTGGARGVTAETCVSLAQACRPTFLLLGRAPLAEDAEPSWAAGITAEAALKGAIAANSGAKLNPRELNRRCAQLLHSREIRANMARLEAAGSVAQYHAVDVRDRSALASVVAASRAAFGPVRGLIHGAGVLADRMIEDKTEAQFDAVFGTKVEGLKNLLSLIDPAEIKNLALFSSSTARFGRKGQVDYAMANEALNKIGASFAKLHPHCRVVAFNWGPWDGGMVTEPLRKIFESEGVGLIPVRAGGDLLVREMARSAGGPIELVVLAAPRSSQPELLQAADRGATRKPEPGSEVGAEVMAFELEINDFPFLKSHVMGEKAVLPMAMTIEWMVQAAHCDNPGLRLTGIEDLRIFKAVTLTPDQNARLSIHAGRIRKQDSQFQLTVEVRVKGTREFVHARAELFLADKPATPHAAELIGPVESYSREVAEVYRMLFHGSHFQGLREVTSYSDEGITAIAAPAPAPSEWIGKPMRPRWLTDPLVLDCGFQLMVLWCQERYGVPSLPTRVGRLRQFRPFNATNAADTRIVVRVTAEKQHQVIAAMEFTDVESGALIARIDGYECVMDGSLNDAFRHNQLAEEALKS